MEGDPASALPVDSMVHDTSSHAEFDGTFGALSSKPKDPGFQSEVGLEAAGPLLERTSKEVAICCRLN